LTSYVYSMTSLQWSCLRCS